MKKKNFNRKKAFGAVAAAVAAVFAVCCVVYCIPDFSGKEYYFSGTKSNCAVALGIRESKRHGFKMPSFRRYFVKKPCNATALLRFFPCNNKNLAS